MLVTVNNSNKKDFRDCKRFGSIISNRNNSKMENNQSIIVLEQHRMVLSNVESNRIYQRV